jgi:hypothetical protein
MARHVIQDVPAPVETTHGRYITKAPVINNRIHSDPEVLRTEAFRDDVGRTLRAHIQEDGTVVFDDPVYRRVFWSGWAR